MKTMDREEWEDQMLKQMVEMFRKMGMDVDEKDLMRMMENIQSQFESLGIDPEKIASGDVKFNIQSDFGDLGEMFGDRVIIYKMNFLNGALRVPLIVRTPETLVSGGGIENDDLVENMDVGPTLVDLAGGELEHRHFGRSLVPTITEKSSDEFHRNEALSEFRGEFMLMADHWKMALNREGDTYLLFNFDDDPEETCNLAGLAEYGRMEDELRLRLLECISKTQLKEP